MTTMHDQVQSGLLDLMTQLAGDWEYAGAIDRETRLLADLGMESLDLVVLGTTIQERYGRLPFSEFLTEIGRRPPEDRDVSVGELVEFICRHGTGVGNGAPR